MTNFPEYLGYTQLPVSNIGGLANSSNDRLTDGIIVHYRAFGSTDDGPFDLETQYNKGRTLTHEMGHFFGLRHIWGDATCGSDLVSDTPTHNTANFGCPTYPHLSTCTGRPVEMTMNYMDYTDDACMFMFSSGQKNRSLAIFAAGGPRASFGD